MKLSLMIRFKKKNIEKWQIFQIKLNEKKNKISLFKNFKYRISPIATLLR